MDVSVVTQFIVTLVSGGALVGVFNYLIQRKKTDQTGFQILEQAWQAQFQQLQLQQQELFREIGKWQEKYRELESKYNDLQQKVWLLNQKYPDIKVPLHNYETKEAK